MSSKHLTLERLPSEGAKKCWEHANTIKVKEWKAIRTVWKEHKLLKINAQKKKTKQKRNTKTSINQG